MSTRKVKGLIIRLAGNVLLMSTLPFFVNRLDYMPKPHARDLQTSIGDLFRPPAGAGAWSEVSISSFMIDADWLLKASVAGLHLNATTAPRVVVLSGEGSPEAVGAAFGRAGYRVLFGGVSLRQWAADEAVSPGAAACILTPHLPVPYGTHHTKAVICANKETLRVAIFTANITIDDWQRKNQGIYMQDFPCRHDGPNGPDWDPNGVGADLSRYFTAAGWTGCDRLFSRFDFRAANIRIIASIPGYHQPGSRWGLWGLRHHLAAAVPAASGESLVWQYSSQGSLTPAFIAALRDAMAPGAEASVAVVFPTEAEVRHSVEGWRAGLSIPVPLKNLSPFVNERLHRFAPPGVALSDSGRHRAMPHIKTYLRYSRASGEVDWLLLTSANLSRAAWGDVQKKGAQLMIRSYELGVLFLPPQPGTSPPPSSRAMELAARRDGLHTLHIGAGRAFLPYAATAPQPYASTAAVAQGRTFQDAPQDVPWVVDMPHRGLDVLGHSTEQLTSYSHYGPVAWNAKVLEAPTRGSDRGDDTTSTNRLVVDVDVDSD